MRFLQVCSLLVLVSPVFAQQLNHETAASETGANLPVQVIGANDLVSIFVYDAPQLSRPARVNADGYIRLPMLKQPIKAAGLYPAGLQAAITKALVDEQILVDPFVTVTISEYQSRPINVVGAVRSPLTFQATQTVTLLEAISRAGGISPDAGNEILVSASQPGPDGKPTTLTRRIPIRALIDDADPSLNMRLTGGEEIRVPLAERIYVVGNVRKPGAFPVQNSGDTTVLQMIALAEGLDRFSNKEAYIYRREASGNKNEIQIPLAKIMRRKAPDVTLEPNDILYIPDSRGRRLAVTALDRITAFGAGAGTALIYTTR